MPRYSRNAPKKTPKTNGYNHATHNPPRLCGWMDAANKELAVRIGFRFEQFYRH